MGLETLFELGQILATPGALQAIAQANQNPLLFIFRHAGGDWGQLDKNDMLANAEALEWGSRLLSAMS